MLKTLAFGVLLMLTASTQAANDIICQDEALVIAELKQKNTRIAENILSLRELQQGEMISEQALTQLLGGTVITPHQINELREKLEQPEPKPQNLEPLCESTAKELTYQQHASERLSSEYAKLMLAFLNLPNSNIIQLHKLQRLSLALNKNYFKFLNQLSTKDIKSDLIPSSKIVVDKLQQQISKLYAAFLNSNSSDFSLLTQHSDVMSINLEFTKGEDNRLTIEQFQDSLIDTRIKLTQIRIDLHDSVWSNLSILSFLKIDNIDKIPDIINREIHLIKWHLNDYFLEIDLRIKSKKGFIYSSEKLFFSTLILSGSLIIIFFIIVAKKLENFAYKIRNNALEKYKKTVLVRFINSINPVLPATPWIFLLFLSNTLENALKDTPIDYILWINPLLKLVLILGILSIFLFWLLSKILEVSGISIQEDLRKSIKKDVRINILIIAIPWILYVVVKKVLGESLILNFLDIICTITLYWRLGLLLNINKNAFIENTERALARDLSPKVKNLLNGRYFTLIAPTLLPIQLLFFITVYSSTLFSNFDWYKRLSARWFWLRSRYLLETIKKENTTAILDKNLSTWFALEPTDGLHFPIIETGIVSTLKNQIDHWLGDKLYENTLLLTGEGGIGKGVALKELKEEIENSNQDTRVILHKITHKIHSREGVRNLIGSLLNIDLDENHESLIKFDKNADPTIIILSKCQNLFLSKIGGLEAWKELIDITNHTLNNIYWLFSINNQSWSYLGNVFGMQYQMRNIIKVKPWTQSEIRSLILSRVNLSGHSIQYDEELLTAYNHPNQASKNAEQRFFSLLWDSCKGTPRIALELFKTAITPKGKELLVGLPCIKSTTDLPNIGNELLFTYRAILTHENLTVREILEITKQSEFIVRYAIKTGVDAQFLFDNRDNRYRISPDWYYTIISFLSRKNMIHG